MAPSLILLHGVTGAPDHRARLLLDNLDQFEADIRAGAIVVITPYRIRVRGLPVSD